MDQREKAMTIKGQKIYKKLVRIPRPWWKFWLRDRWTWQFINEDGTTAHFGTEFCNHGVSCFHGAIPACNTCFNNGEFTGEVYPASLEVGVSD